MSLARRDFILDPTDKNAHTARAFLTGDATANRHRMLAQFTLADDQHVGQPLLPGAPDLGADGVRLGIDMNPDT